jgi:tape measure domain-containing protein
MPTPNEVELLIKARNEAGKTLDRLDQQLGDIVTSQKALATSSALAAKSQKDFADEARRLFSVQDELSKVVGKVDGYKRQQAALVELRKTLDQQRERYRALRDEIVATEKPTQALKDRFTEAGNAARQTLNDLRSGQGKLGALAAELDKAGISATNLADAEGRIASQQSRAAAALEQTRTAAIHLADAQKQIAASDAEAVKRSKDITDEIKRRAAAEELAVQKRIDAQKRFNELLGVRPTLAARAPQQTDAVLDSLSKELARREQIEKTLAEQKAAQEEINKRNLDAEESLKRQQAAQVRINALLNVRSTDTEAQNRRRADIQAAFAEDAAQRVAKAQDLQAAAAQRVLEINQRANAVEERLAAEQAQRAQNTSALSAAFQRLAGSLKQGADATERTATASRSATAEQTRLAGSTSRLTSASDAAVKKQNQFNEAQRTALSLYQRIRGQVLSLAGAYVGVFGALEFVRKSIDAVNTQAGIQSRLLVASGGDANKAAVDYQHLQDTANKLGLDFKSLAGEYASFAIAAKSANLTAEQTNFIFEAFAETSRVFRLSTEDTAGVFKALSQILSKAKIQAEELRGQLGDRLSGAFNVLAQSIGKTPAQLDKLLESGKLSSDFLLLFAREYKKIVAEQVPAATQTLDAKINRLNNALFNLQVAFLSGPFQKELEALIQRTTDFLKSDDGANFAKTLSEAFAIAAHAALVLADNIKLIGTVIGVVFVGRTITTIKELGGVVVIAGKAVRFLAAALGIGGLATAAEVAGKSLLALIGGPIGVLIGLAATGITIAIKFKLDKEKAITEGIDKALGDAGDAVQALREAKTQADLAPVLADAQRKRDEIVKELQAAQEAVKSQESSIFDFAHLNESGQQRDERIQALKDNVSDVQTKLDTLDASIRDAEQRMGRLPAATEKAVDTALAGNKGLSDALKAQFDALEKQAADLKIPDAAGDKAAKKAAAAAKKLADLQARLKEQFSRQAEEIGKDLGEAEAKSLDRATDIINADSDKKIRQLQRLKDALISAKLPEFASQIDDLIAKVEVARTKAIETKTAEFAQKDATKAEAELNKLLEQRAQLVQTTTQFQQAGILTQKQAAETIKDGLDQLDPALDAAIEKALTFARALGGEEGDAMVSRIKQLRDQLRLTRVELTAAQQQVVDIFANNITTSLTDVAKSLGHVIKGTESIGDAFKDLGQITQQFFSSLLIDIGQAILKQIILNALLAAAKSSGAGGSIIGGIASLLHSGGPADAGKPRLVDPAIFKNAIRYHSGGIVGLKSDEIPAVLQKGEFVLSKNDPNNPLNARRPAGQAPVQNIQVLNTIDTESIFQAGAASQTFKKVILNIVRAERSSFKQALS